MSCLPGSHASEVKVSAGGTDRKGTEREPGLLPVSLWRLVCLPSGWTRPRSAGAGGHPGKRPDALCRKRVLQPHFTCRNGILITLGQSRGRCSWKRQCRDRRVKKRGAVSSSLHFSVLFPFFAISLNAVLHSYACTFFFYFSPHYCGNKTS